MAKLIFYEAEHIYEVDGEEYPSVSELSRFASREIYGDVSQYNLDNAAERGRKVHKATEVLDKYGNVEADSEIENYVRAHVQFRKDYGIKEFEYIEKAFASHQMRYAGTIDRVCVVNGKRAIIDEKSSYAVKKVLAKIQLNAYKRLYEENTGNEIEALYILHLKPDGTYKLIEFEMDESLFVACLTLHRALETKKRKTKKGANENVGTTDE